MVTRQGFGSRHEHRSIIANGIPNFTRERKNRYPGTGRMPLANRLNLLMEAGFHFLFDKGYLRVLRFRPS